MVRVGIVLEEQNLITDDNDPSLAFFIGVAKNNAEDRLHTHSPCISFFSCLILGTTSSSKDDGGYVLLNNK